MESFSDSIVYEFLFQNPVQYPMRAFSHSTEFWKHYLFVFPMQLSCLYCLWLQDGINSSQCLACYHNQWLHLFQWFIASGCIVLLQLLKFVCMWHCRHCHPEQSVPKSLASSVVDLYLYLMIAWSRSIFNSCFLPAHLFYLDSDKQYLEDSSCGLHVHSSIPDVLLCADLHVTSLILLSFWISFTSSNLLISPISARIILHTRCLYRILL